MGPQDAVKLCYQAAFGAGHILQDRTGAYRNLKREYDSLEAGEGPLYEQIHPNVCRVNLSAWKREGLPLEWLFCMFEETAAHPPENGMGIFRECLDTVGRLLREQAAAAAGGPQPEARAVNAAGEPQPEAQAVNAAGEPQPEACAVNAAGEPQPEAQAVNMTVGQWDGFLATYPLCQPEAVHHSERYRSEEHPAYRLVCSRFIRLFPILQAIVHMPRERAVVALDGRCASGKTTLAKQLSKVTGAGVVHMDDFFLPSGLRSPERLSEPGGNVHYERFMEEVLVPLRDSRAFRYRCFDCGRMELGPEREVREGGLRIVEGVYSCHPVFGDYMGLRVFCDVEPQEQLRRVRGRDGAGMLKRFQDQWIPMEERYFRYYQIREKADLVL